MPSPRRTCRVVEDLLGVGTTKGFSIADNDSAGSAKRDLHVSEIVAKWFHDAAQRQVCVGRESGECLARSATTSMPIDDPPKRGLRM